MCARFRCSEEKHKMSGNLDVARFLLEHERKSAGHERNSTGNERTLVDTQQNMFFIERCLFFSD